MKKLDKIISRSLTIMAQSLYDDELRKYAHGTCVSIGTRSKCPNASVGEISKLEGRIVSRSEKLVQRLEQLQKISDEKYSKFKSNIEEVIERILRRAFKNTFLDLDRQERLANLITRFERLTGRNLSLPRSSLDQKN